MQLKKLKRGILLRKIKPPVPSQCIPKHPKIVEAQKLGYFRVLSGFPAKELEQNFLFLPQMTLQTIPLQ